jgi:hypothetical protein
MKVQVFEEKYEPPVELLRTKKIILTRQEYDNFKTAFCKGKGWSLGEPHTVNVHSITLKGNYKWMPTSDVEFQIDIEGQEKVARTEASNNDTKMDIEKEKL